MNKSYKIIKQIKINKNNPEHSQSLSKHDGSNKKRNKSCRERKMDKFTKTQLIFNS